MEATKGPHFAQAWLADGGECGALVRALDWSKTPLGAVADWPASLKTTVGTLLHSRQPMFLWWGPDLIQIYNDGYVPSFGKGKHPAALGQRGKDCWQEIWPIIGPQIDDVMRLAKASWNDDALVPVWRNDRIEEVYWTYGYSPVFDESGAVGGTLVVCIETTARVLAERRLHTLHLLAERAARATTKSDVLAAVTAALEECPSDVPFALLYLVDAKGAPMLARVVGLDPSQGSAIDAAMRTELTRAEPGALIAIRPPDALLQLAPWPEPVSSAAVFRISDREKNQPSGFVVFGVSPRLSFDGSYRAHLDQIADHVGLALSRIDADEARSVAAAARNNLLLTAPVATALFRGPDHVFELANPLYCRMVGRVNLVGKTYREAFPELVDTALPGVLDRVYQTGEPYASGEMLVPLDIKGDGVLQECFFTFNLEALRDVSGNVYGMMAVAHEITDQVRARRSIEESQADREALLVNLETANRAKDEFLAMLGHELRNPLAPIVTALHLMRRQGEVNREQEIIERQVRHLGRLVDDLLDVSRLTRGKITLKKELIEISDVLANAVEMASDLFEDRRQQLSIDVPKEGLRIEGDPIRLAQVAANLLTNAARYTDPGGVISVRARRVGAEIVIVVKDNGAGISPELLPRVFDLFVQGQQKADRKEGGLGLGLTLVKNLVSMQGGVVEARSEGLGKGSEFEIRLPTSSKTVVEPHTPPPSSTSAKPGKSKRILVVDDNVDSAEMMTMMLESVGYEVAMAHDGPEALAAIENFTPDVALLDIGLPVMTGYELGERLHASPQAKNCRLIALTGYGQSHDRERSKASGFEAHLVKPIDMRALLQLIASDVTPRAS